MQITCWSDLNGEPWTFGNIGLFLNGDGGFKRCIGLIAGGVRLRLKNLQLFLHPNSARSGLFGCLLNSIRGRSGLFLSNSQLLISNFTCSRRVDFRLGKLVLSHLGLFLDFRSLLLNFGERAIHHTPLLTGVVGIRDSRNSNYNRSYRHPEIRVCDYAPTNPRKSDSYRPLIGYCYGALGVTLIFLGIVSIGVVGNITRWYLRIIALFVAILLIFGAIRSIYHAADLFDGKIVPQKCLTPDNSWGTVIQVRRTSMANILPTDKKIAVIGALAEGSSIRSIERITGVHRDTIMRLGVKVGQGCTALMDAKMRDLSCNRLEMDEIWGFVGKKDRSIQPGDDPKLGNVWTFCAVDAETKLVPAFKVGNRDTATATAFMQDVAGRMRNRVQISTDGLRAYVEAVEKAFGADVDYAQIVKTYGHEEVSDNRRYSAPEFVSSEKKVFVGNPDQQLISTSYVERLNATTRLHMRRLTRLTLAFSKKRENFEAAVGLHFAYYNFVKRHSTIRCTPAMAAGVERGFWSVGDLVEATA